MKLYTYDIPDPLPGSRSIILCQLLLSHPQCRRVAAGRTDLLLYLHPSSTPGSLNGLLKLPKQLPSAKSSKHREKVTELQEQFVSLMTTHLENWRLKRTGRSNWSKRKKPRSWRGLGRENKSRKRNRQGR